ncbi:23S rRNA Um-2552 2'-O-methyltransferase [Magnetococcus marinus MC-1]|uniref:Ribosomal RNA large subunit methyltransferase E n=1 Tax=Magnetococcus marinus (strain ATCC BAA-1437 / JCM 17883 / MC-1) TaxID=156889 RepID=RLME_MAGMM|nr:RlmE family RNA methyltransferase [Magnetococcus marinus]A0LC14.1 RecName: Full=Ribosomal RNA large subunit methyltransferase E; AltName: Full=23S rRNA Um2552 methyltransferase; AltName: Full=rRNA (uridine-2'-O-)-methyltransferase [Magnetococcus marinus MC-1]ABK45507.1 23S rRNA Um-2552 2'-O-methyltransferase [Magnetococcus marinus MC-1]
MAKQRPSSKRWLREHHNDPYVQQARREGYRSRAAYKLMELQEVVKEDGKSLLLIPVGANVVELGAAPGGWTQVAVKLAGVEGSVVGIDLLAMDPVPGAEILVGDFLDDAMLAQLQGLLHEGRVDVVLSDMAPNMCGVKSADQLRGEALAEAAFQFVEENLKTGGNFAVKLFNGPGFHDMVKQARAMFTVVKVVKPDSSRSRSPEHYLVGMGFKG